jgi:hypothetical protein
MGRKQFIGALIAVLVFFEFRYVPRSINGGLTLFTLKTF